MFCEGLTLFYQQLTQHNLAIPKISYNKSGFLITDKTYRFKDVSQEWFLVQTYRNNSHREEVLQIFLGYYAGMINELMYKFTRHNTIEGNDVCFDALLRTIEKFDMSRKKRMITLFYISCRNALLKLIKYQNNQEKFENSKQNSDLYQIKLADTALKTYELHDFINSFSKFGEEHVQILFKYYGVLDVPQKSLRQLAKEEGVSPQRIHQIVQETIKKIKKHHSYN